MAIKFRAHLKFHRTAVGGCDLFFPNQMLIPFARPYSSRYGAPVLTQVDSVIFTARYFRHCMACAFCNDQCCYFGADVDTANVALILKHADELQARVGRAPREWFEPEIRRDPEYPGGEYTRTVAYENRCVFLQQGTRGCHLHSFSLEKNMDYHLLKPMDCCIFPITFDKGVLVASEEVDDKSLICVDRGDSLYAGVRGELEYYFGSAFVTELDLIAERIQTVAPA